LQEVARLGEALVWRHGVSCALLLVMAV